MPYQSLADLPANVKGLPKHAQEIWQAAFNSAFEQYDGDDTRARKVAWAAVKNKYRKSGDEWVAKKEAGEVEDVEDEEFEGILDEDGKALWSTAKINNLPDSSFLYVEPGGEKDDEGKTKPRNLRHLPYKDESGKVDGAHLRNALSRLGQAATGTGWLTEDLRKRLVSKAQGVLKKLGGKKELITRIVEGVKEAIRELFPPAGTKEEQPVLVRAVKGADGVDRIVIWATNAFQDRDGELFATKALEDYVAWSDGQETKGTIDLWHIPRTDFADIEYQAMVGRFLLEVGRFRDNPIGRAVKEFLTKYPRGHPDVAPQGWGASPQFRYRREDRADGIFDWVRKEKTSVLPREAAANPWNPSMEVVVMDEAKKQALETILGPELAASLEQTGEETTKQLEEEVAHKEGEATAAVEKTDEAAVEAQDDTTVEEEVAEEATEAVETKEEPEVPAEAPAAEQQPAMADLLRQIVGEALQPISDRLAAVEATMAGTKEAVEEEEIPAEPAESFAMLIKQSIIGREECLVDGRSSLAKKGPEETEVKERNVGLPIPLLNTIINDGDWRKELGIETPRQVNA